MYKIETKFRNFRYNSSVSKNTLNVTWLVYEDDEDKDPRGFSEIEKNKFIDYIVGKTNNFPQGNKNCLRYSEDELDGYYDLSSEFESYIAQLILSPNLKLELNDRYSGDKYVKMVDSTGSDNHNYSLPFDVIGFVTNIN